MILIIILLIGYMFGLYLWFEKAGESGWKAFVPYFRISTWVKLTKKPKWYIFGSFVPVLNLFIYTNLIGELSDTYRRHSWWEHTIAILGGFLWLPYIGKKESEVYHGPGGESGAYKKPAKNTVREWADALIFAIFAAYIIRTFIFEIYAIPTSSMEGTLRIGDVLVVSKFHYGSRVPNTPIAFPLVHHSFPKFLGGGKSYLEWIKLPYKRLPELESIKRNDMVVFNFPANDTTTKEFDSAYPYYDIIKDYQYQLGLTKSEARNAVWNGFGQPVPNLINNFSKNIGVEAATKVVTSGFTIVARPVDKRENYIKRCVGIPGDIVEIKKGELFINGAPAYVPENLQFRYMCITNGTPISSKEFHKLDITEFYSRSNNTYEIYTTKKQAEALKQLPQVNTVSVYFHNDQNNDFNAYEYTYYPHHKDFRWNLDNYGPITIPSKGMTIPLNKENYLLYERCISVYENNALEIKGGKAFINGVEAKAYTFKMNYYWMMGDNRHRSQDSRFWGFVPEDHIVGKAWFLVTSYSKEKKFLRLGRTFNPIHGKWAPKDEKFTK